MCIHHMWQENILFYLLFLGPLQAFVRFLIENSEKALTGMII